MLRELGLREGTSLIMLTASTIEYANNFYESKDTLSNQPVKTAAYVVMLTKYMKIFQ